MSGTVSPLGACSLRKELIAVPLLITNATQCCVWTTSGDQKETGPKFGENDSVRTCVGAAGSHI